MGCAKFPFTILLVTIWQVSDAYIESLVTSVLIHKSDSASYEPMVAFLCNKPAMVRVPDGWMHDSSQNCTKDVEEILNFCKKKYPNHNINNVVPSHTPVTINNWCRFGTDHCHRHNNHTVKPYRCLSGMFKSSALLVPEHCMFDHYHDRKLCANEKHWSAEATERCKAKGFVKQSYDILLPCKQTNEFMGVEYVCCPTSLKPHLTIEVHVEHPHEPPKVADPNHGVKTKPSVDRQDRAYFRYLHETMDNGKEEHEKYEIARRDWQRYHRAKITEMMKDWSAARDRVVQLKATDPKRAETLQSEIGQKYQKLYHALEEDGMAEREQLDTIHQNHVQRKFNENKRVTMQKFMDELQLEKPDESKLLQALEQYIRVEEKDRRHAVNHYEHVRDVNPAAAKVIKSATVDHLRWIEKRISQSIKMLHRFPEIERRIQPEIDQFLRRFTGIEASAKVITTPEVVDEQRKVVEKYRTQTPEIKADVDEKVADKKVDVVEPAKKVDVIEEVSVKGEKDKPKDEEKVEAFDSETMENEHKYVDDEKTGFVAHQTDSRMQQDEVAVHKQSVESGGVYGATVGIAIGSVSVFVVIIVAMVMLKKRARKPLITHGFVEVDQAISPEERHVANMQINGYENPTYKYFEK